jgi:adenine-specific DNA-methyltransferase
MSKKFEKMKSLLEELFQLDQPELDFGFYKVMHAKSAEVSQFLDKDLLPQVEKALSQYQSADKVGMVKELDELIAGIKNAGMNPENSPKVQELKERIKEDSVDLDSLEADVYNHLYRFFRRYYHEGDFISKRVYKEGVYAIPYEGEEVKLHWANHDQYYIKTSEYLRDYAFKLKPHDKKNPMRVHFRLVDAAEGEHGNVKESQKRVFIIASKDALSEEEGELVIKFEYRPATMNDWPEDKRDDPKKPPVKEDLLIFAVEAILAEKTDFAGWVEQMATAYTKSNGEKADYSRLRAHLNRYVARNTFDYFIHKDLGRFLRRELDFYIKNEVMHLDDIENESVPRVEQMLSKIKVIRKIASKVIDFLAQLEDFQKKLWLKKKFVVETNYCVTLDRVPEKLYPDICENDVQREEWVELFAIDDITGTDDDLLGSGNPAYSEPLSIEFLMANDKLVLDTRFFDDDFKVVLLESIEDFDEQCDGVLIHSENFQALQLLQRRYREKVKCVYIDPPYNAKSSEILYKNTYKHASWLSLMSNRVEVSKPFLTEDFVYVTAIDEIENMKLGLMYEYSFPLCENAVISIVHNPTGQQGKNFSFTHEFAHFVYPQNRSLIGLEDRMTALRDSNPDIRPLRNVSSGKNHLRESAVNCFYPIYVKDGVITGFGEVCPDTFHPAGINVIRDDGVIEVYPIDPSNNESKWVFAKDTVETISSELTAEFDKKKKQWDIIRKKTKFRYKSLWSDKRYSANSWGSVILNQILPNNPFTYPKSIFNVKDCIDAGMGNGSGGNILDYFAGSGTTGHAVINLNREDAGNRKYILVEMGGYFDTVLKPRIAKVVYSDKWKDGKPVNRTTGVSHCFKYIRLESYEDTLNNLVLEKTSAQQSLLLSSSADGEGGLREEHLLNYMLDVESRGSQSLLNISAFSNPTEYRLKVKSAGSDESQEVNVDLLETFNYLIGLTVNHIASPQLVTASFKRDDDPDLPEDIPQRLLLDGRIKEDVNGTWWFRTVSGTMPDGLRVLVIWRNRPGGEDEEGMEQDNLMLNKWFAQQGYSSKDSEFDLIFINGDNNVENLKAPDDTWKVRLIEENFHRLMFADEDA